MRIFFHHAPYYVASHFARFRCWLQADVYVLAALLHQDVLPRHSELVDPAVANVDHALLVFALEQPPVSAGVALPQLDD